MPFQNRLHAIAPIVGSHLFSVSCQAIVMIFFHFNAGGLGCCVCSKCVSYSMSVLVILSSTKSVDFGSNHSLAPYDCILPREFKQFPSYNASCQDKPSHMILRQFRKILHLVVVDVGKKARARRLEWVRHLEPWTIKQPSLLKIFMTQKYLWQICLQSAWHISASGILLEVIQ